MCDLAHLAAESGDPRFAVVSSKLASRRLIADLGLAHAETYAVVESAMLTVHLRDECVAKPLDGDASIGVVALVRRSDKWFDLRRGRWFTDETLELLAANVAAQKPMWGDDWIVEELLRSPHDHVPIADEFKVYTFGGVPRFVLQRRAVTGRTGYRVWSPHGDCITDILAPTNLKIIDPMLDPPFDIDGIVDIARTVAAALPDLGFHRVDVFESTRGLCVGEVNGWVGGAQYHPYWDRLFVEWWNSALAVA